MKPFLDLKPNVTDYILVMKIDGVWEKDEDNPYSTQAEAQTAVDTARRLGKEAFVWCKCDPFNDKFDEV